MNENQVYTILLGQSPQEFTLDIPVDGVILDVDAVNGTLSVLGNRSNEMVTRSFVQVHKNESVPSGTLAFVGSFRAADASRLFVFEILS